MPLTAFVLSKRSPLGIEAPVVRPEPPNVVERPAGDNGRTAVAARLTRDTLYWITKP